jgi:putative ubiquitin-RnfH superfamily antitoxin RatB of RatAB toxin-antitoxin module
LNRERSKREHGKAQVEQVLSEGSIMGDTKLLLKLMLERDDQVFVDNNQLGVFKRATKVGPQFDKQDRWTS